MINLLIASLLLMAFAWGLDLGRWDDSTPLPSAWEDACP